MTISQALANATSGLTATSARANVTANNIANALTEGYSRRDAVASERVTDGVGAGVKIAGVTRAENSALTSARREAGSRSAFDQTTSSALSQISDLLGDPEDANALFKKYAQLETGLRSLANTPDSASAQLAVVNAAKDIAATFNRIESAYQQIRADADAAIAQSVNDVNIALVQIEELNGEISKGIVAGRDVNALLDQRQVTIDSVSEAIPIRKLNRDNGAIDLMTTEGVFLLAGSARQVEFSISPVVASTSAYAGGAGGLSGISVDGIDITPGGPSSQPLQSGSIAANFGVRDRLLPDAALALDALALDISERFSAPGLDASVTTGAPGLFTDAGALASPANIAGLAGRISVNAVVDPNAGGETFRIRDGLGLVSPIAAGSDTFVRSLIAALDRRCPCTCGPAILE